MAWCQIGDKPLSEPMLTQGRWVNFTQDSKVDVTSHDTVWTNYHYISWSRMLQAAIECFDMLNVYDVFPEGYWKGPLFYIFITGIKGIFRTYALKCIPCYQDLIDWKAKVFQMWVCRLLARHYLMKLCCSSFMTVYGSLWTGLQEGTKYILICILFVILGHHI